MFYLLEVLDIPQAAIDEIGLGEEQDQQLGFN